LREILSVKTPDAPPPLGINEHSEVVPSGADFYRSEILTLFLAEANALRLLAHKNV